MTEVTALKFNSLIPELTVRNIEASRKFYVDILGFRIEYERPENKFIFLSLEGSQIMLEQENGHWNTGSLDYPYGRGINLEMTVSDTESMYRNIIEKGIKPFRELSTDRYDCNGTDIVQKQFLIQDPDGYLLRFTD